MFQVESFFLFLGFLACALARDSTDNVVVMEHKTTTEVVVDAGFDALLGVFLVILAFPCLYFNELRQVHMSKIYDFAEKTVVDVDDHIKEHNKASVVCVRGTTSTDEKLKDPKLGVEVTKSAKLVRTVEMYQWAEQCKTESTDNSNGSKDIKKTYSYAKQWSSFPISSAHFHDKKHTNPAMPLQSQSWTAKDVHLGDFSLDASLVSQMTKEAPADVAEQKIGEKSLKRKRPGTIESGGSSPDVGDLRIKMRKVECGQASVLSVQKGDEPGTSFEPLTYELVPRPGWCCSQPKKVDLSKAGHKPQIKGLWSCCRALFEGSLHTLVQESTTGKKMIQDARSGQKALHYFVMIVGWFMFFGGFYYMFAFVPAIFRYLPFLGIWIEAFGKWVAFLSAFILANVMWILTVGFAWLFVKPIRGLSLLVLAAAIIVMTNEPLRQFMQEKVMHAQ